MIFLQNHLPEVEEMDELEKLKLEKQLLGFFLTGHPVDTLGAWSFVGYNKGEDLEN